ncbi:unnamed protein product, partial [Nesidiocoris tenuis]
VSLNRHMRMHSASPGASERSASPQPAIDRYCQNCDIRFSSSKTFRAHKMHYCSTRHVVKQPKSGSIASPESPGEPRPSSPSRGGGSPVAITPRGVPHLQDHPAGPPQPYLALPTNPILIVPYSLIQSASLLPAPITGGLQHAPDTAYFLLPDGTLQPMATASISSSPSQSTVRAPQLEKPSRPVVAFHSPPPHIQQQPLKPVVEKAKTNEQPNGSPLDLSCRRSVEKDVVLMDTSEDEKENRLMVHNSNAQRLVSSPEHEDIICAPSIPLMLSTSSTCSSPSPAPLSPASSSSQSACKRGELKRPQSEQSAHSNSPSPKSSIVSPSPQMKSPRRTPNGISGKSRDRHTPEGPPPSWTKENSNINLQSLLLAAVSAQSQMDQLKPDLQNLPFPPEFIPHLTAMYNSRFAAAKAKSMPLPPGMLPPGVSGGGLPPPIAIPMASRSPAEFLNQASLLLTSEMALRLAAAQSSPAADLPPPSVPPPPPQVLVKQGDSKCQECNIVFYKLENYIAHKKHYCSARKLPSAVESSQEEKTPSPLASSPPQTMSPPKSESTKSKSPIGNQIASTSKPGALYQFICAACGIKFTSYDNLTAHQTYYCPKRNPNEPDKARRCNKCKNAVVGDHQCSGSSLGWKCPCCSVVSPTASAAQKHMDTHSGVKAFLCTICRYKGNTLRGMRTHIRMHFDKRPAEINEEKYITCVVEDGTSIIHEPSPSSSSSLLIIDEEPIVVPPPKSASVSARLAPSPSVAVDDKSCNGTTISIKEETSPEEPEDARVVEAPTVVGPEEDEYIEVEDVPGLPVKEEVVDEPSIKIEPDDDVEDKTINNNRQSPGAVGGIAGGVAGTPKYCETCDISFTYLSTFIAHKKFYCTGVVTTDSSINSSSNNNNNNNNNSKRSTGTPVTKRSRVLRLCQMRFYRAVGASVCSASPFAQESTSGKIESCLIFTRHELLQFLGQDRHLLDKWRQATDSSPSDVPVPPARRGRPFSKALDRRGAPSAQPTMNLTSPTAVDVFNGTANDDDEDPVIVDPQYFSYRYRIVGTFFISIVFIVGVLGNAMVVLVVTRVRALNSSPTNCYLVSLAVADTVVLVAAVPNEILSYYLVGNQWIWGEAGCAVFVFCQNLGINASSLSLVAFTVERYIAICHPMKAHKICTRGHAERITAFVWTFAALYCAPWLGLTKTERLHYRGYPGGVTSCVFRLPRNKYLIYFFADLVMFYVAPLLASCVLYTLISLALITRPVVSVKDPKMHLDATNSTQSSKTKVRPKTRTTGLVEGETNSTITPTLPKVIRCEISRSLNYGETFQCEAKTSLFQYGPIRYDLRFTTVEDYCERDNNHFLRRVAVRQGTGYVEFSYITPVRSEQRSKELVNNIFAKKPQLFTTAGRSALTSKVLQCYRGTDLARSDPITIIACYYPLDSK